LKKLKKLKTFGLVDCSWAARKFMIYAGVLCLVVGLIKW